jgi:hypothetical protein
MVLVVLAVLVIGVPLFYADHKGGINEVIYWVSRAELFPFIWTFHDASVVWRFMDTHPPQTITFHQAKLVLSIAGSYARWIVAPAMVASGVLFYHVHGWIEKYNRTFTMKTLLVRNAEFVYCLRPVARRKQGWLLDEPTGTGPWRVAESPMLFALRHEMISNESGAAVPENWCYQKNGLPRSVPNVPQGGYRFNEKKANQVFISRIGPPVPNGMRDFTNRYPAYMRGLAGAFCAFGLGQRDEGQRILDAMSESFDEAIAVAAWDRNEVAGHFPINILTAEAWMTRALKRRPLDASDSEANLARYVQKTTDLHKSFLYVWLGAMLDAARFNGGVLPSHEFLWLRPTNRELWYFLNSMGGNSVHSEGAAAWAHYRAETVLGKPILYTAVVDAASGGLRKAIGDEGWFEKQP